jgi:RNA polymerase sigma-70 factor (ECF subfamily)
MAIDIEATYAKYGPMVLRRCRALLGDEEEAVDAMQGVFVKLVEKRDEYHDDALASLLWQMSTHHCLNIIRSKKRRPEDAATPSLERVAQTTNDLERRSGARDLLARLFGRTKPSTAVIATMHYVDGMTLAETADAVGMSVSGVRKRLRGLRAELHAMEDS